MTLQRHGYIYMLLFRAAVRDK